MNIKRFINIFFMVSVLISGLMVTGCSKDEDEEPGPNGGAVLTVNGNKWEALSLPVYDGDVVFFNCETESGSGHMFYFNENLDNEDLEIGDEIMPEEIIFPSENALYRYASGNIEIKNRSSDSVTLKFDSYKVKYSGEWASGMPDSRDDDIVDATYLTFNGTITFYNKQSI